MLQDDVLALLREAGADYRSGEAMSRALGVSRAAVWKAVEALRGAGYGILSSPSRGYRLASAPDDLRARSEERRVGKECRSRWSPYH